MPKKTDSNHDDIFADLDKASIKHSYCSCSSMLAFLVLLLFLALSGSLWAVKHLQNKLSGTTVSVPKEITVQDIVNRLKDFSLIEPSPERPSVTITQEELTALLAPPAKKELSIKDLQVSITPNEMVIFGTAAKPLQSSLTIHIKPILKDGKPVFDVTRVKAGRINLPEFLLTPLESQISTFISRKLPLGRDSNLQKLETGPGFMIVQ